MEGFYPIHVKVSSRKVLIVGGGEVALRKVKNLLSYGAQILVVSPRVLSEIEQLSVERKVTVFQEKYSSNFLEGCCLVFGATDDREVNKRVAVDAQKAGIPVNIADNPSLCTFLVPAVLKRGSLTVSVSTEGKSPSLSGRIKRNLENSFGEEFSLFLDYLGEVRKEILQEIKDPAVRKKIFIEISDPEMVKLVQGGDLSRLKAKCREIINKYQGQDMEGV